MTTVYVRAGRAEVKRAIAAAVAAVSGRAPAATGEVRQLQLLAGMTALSLIKDAFVQKSAGGVDAAGDHWQPLAPSTVARRRKGKRGAGQPQILRDTGLLLNSLSPGVSGPAAGLQVLQTLPGEVVLGTNRKGAVYHHQGVPGKLPQRRLWPEPARWPAAWWESIARKVREGAARVIVRLLGG